MTDPYPTRLRQAVVPNATAQESTLSDLQPVTDCTSHPEQSEGGSTLVGLIDNALPTAHP
jgi:hypothetical protein